MHWLICGTFPDEKPTLIAGPATVKLGSGLALRDENATDSWPQIPADSLIVHDAGLPLPDGGRVGPWHLPIGRGTPALAAAAAITARELDGAMPYVLLAGDDGKGAGSRAVYQYLCENAARYSGWGITLHYLLPDVDWHNRILMAMQELPERPLLCADAGYMYAAKMSGYAAEYDLFTPDIGELAFLADEDAPHPFYTRGFLLADEEDAPELIKRAHEHENAAKTMLVKGRTDMVVQNGQVLERVNYPMVPHLEPIGGTGDTVAGIASALLAAGLPMARACSLAARANRYMGQLAQPTPATQISELLSQLPGGIRLAMQEVA